MRKRLWLVGMPEPGLPRIEGEGFVLRPWQVGDLDSLVLHANDESVSRTVSDRFPFPYTRRDAEKFLREPAKPPTIVLAIEIDGAAVGGIDVRPGAAEFRIGGEIGYWLARRYWGQGAMSRVVRCWCDHLFSHYGFERLQAAVFSNNPASARVLEKVGFQREGVLRRAVIKHDKSLDLWMYAMLRAEPTNPKKYAQDD